MLKKIGFVIFFLGIFSTNYAQLSSLKVTPNQRYLSTTDGKPFFWLGDTGWLLFTKLTREEAVQYLEDRRQKGFNVIQVMGLHTLNAVNLYGDSALVNHNIARPLTTTGNRPEVAQEYDFWDHIDYVIDQAAARGIYIAFVPMWGGNVKNKAVTPERAKVYATFLAKRFLTKSNIIWLNGGDIKGSEGLAVWQIFGKTIRQIDTKHLMTYHPRGRTSSSEWFHQQTWLDFNMVQSGHRTYAQDTSKNEQWHYGEDNWRYIQADYQRTPTKPVIDGEPSYEGIPHGLHDETQPRWTADEVRRYGYWSVFAGAFGYTYGQNAVMQMHRQKGEETSFGPLEFWHEGMKAQGSFQMQYLKNLLLSKPFFERKPAQFLIQDQGKKYDYLLATAGKKYAFVYTYTGRTFSIKMSHLTGNQAKVSWYNPRNGTYTLIGTFPTKGVQTFDPPAETKAGNDWVLVLENQ